MERQSTTTVADANVFFLKRQNATVESLYRYVALSYCHSFEFCRSFERTQSYTWLATQHNLAKKKYTNIKLRKRLTCEYTSNPEHTYSFIDSFIQTIYIAPLQVRYNSEALPTQHEYSTGVSRRSVTGNSESWTCPITLCGGLSGILNPGLSVKKLRFYQFATKSHCYGLAPSINS